MTRAHFVRGAKAGREGAVPRRPVPARCSARLVVVRFSHTPRLQLRRALLSGYTPHVCCTCSWLRSKVKFMSPDAAAGGDYPRLPWYLRSFPIPLPFHLVIRDCWHGSMLNLTPTQHRTSSEWAVALTVAQRGVLRAVGVRFDPISTPAPTDFKRANLTIDSKRVQAPARINHAQICLGLVWRR